MTAMLRERLTKALESALMEAHESSKDMIRDNIEAGLEHDNRESEAGAFSDDELTDMENLVNKGDNANTTDKSDEVSIETNVAVFADGEDDIDSIMRELVNISEPEHAEEKHLDREECEHCHHDHDDEFEKAIFGESAFAKMALRILKESDYAGNLDFVPDTRLNVADVVNALKGNIGEGSEGIHVDLDYDEEGNKIYKVSQIDKEKLPKTLEVVNVQLKLGDEGYTVEKTREDFPVKKD